MSLKELIIGAALAAGCSCAAAKAVVARNNCSYYPDGRILCSKDRGIDTIRYYRGGIIEAPYESIAVATSTCAVTIEKKASGRWLVLMDYGCDNLVDQYIGNSLTGKLSSVERHGNEDAFKRLFDITFNYTKDELLEE